VEIVYRAPRSRPSRRRLDPYFLWQLDGALYVIGHDHARRDTRTFLLDRIESAAATGAPFLRPARLTLEAYLQGSYRVYRGEAVDVRLWFDREVTHYVLERPLHPSQQARRQPDGSLAGKLHVGGLPELKSKILSFGRHARVLGPAAFAREVKDELVAAADLYRRAGPARAPGRAASRRSVPTPPQAPQRRVTVPVGGRR
jgi:predicted DNA-binding transcriptional regulator YafY